MKSCGRHSRKTTLSKFCTSRGDFPRTFHSDETTLAHDGACPERRLSSFTCLSPFYGIYKAYTLPVIQDSICYRASDRATSDLPRRMTVPAPNVDSMLFRADWRAPPRGSLSAPLPPPEMVQSSTCRGGGRMKNI